MAASPAPSADQLAIIRQMVRAEQATRPFSATGLVRPGTVASYDYLNRQAQVLLDGDATPVLTPNITDVFLVQGQRVMVLFQPPAGLMVIGTIRHADAVRATRQGTASISNASLVSVPLLAGFDPYSLFNSSGQFVVPTGMAGVWGLSASADVSPTTPDRFLVQWTDGTTVWRGSAGPDSTGTVEFRVSAAVSIWLNEGATLTPQVFQTSGAVRTVAFRFDAVLIQQTASA